jgi:amino acid adenylation domain-containing protein
MQMEDMSNGITSSSSRKNSDWFTQAVSEGPEMAENGRSQLTEAERRQLLEEWNQTAVAFPSNVCVHELFEAQSARTPDRVAVRFGEETLSYRELNEQANQLAHHLRSLGVASGSLVGLCVNRGVRMLVGLIAILKAGGAYVPLEPDNPKSRLAHQVMGAVALVTEANLVERFTEFKRPVIRIDTEEFLWRSKSGLNIERSTNSENLVYVIFTSGSTGVPKGVAVRHRNLVNYINFIQRRLELDQYPEGWHFATVSTLSADLGNTSIFPALASGGTVGVIVEEIAMDSARLARYSREHPIDVLKIVPSHLEALLAGSEGTGVLPRKYLILGGEPLSKRLVRLVRDLGADCEIGNHYGPTETTVESVVLRLTDYRELNGDGPAIPIGRPIDNTQIYILDQHLQPVPVGVAGELYISGEGVGAGYLNQPELTAGRFIDNPFVPNSKMYRTGDLCRYMPDGNVEFLGRIDDQIKVRGFRVELGEIEATLAKHPSVKQAVVVAKTDVHGDKQLIAYVVGPSPTEGIGTYLKEWLPDYMVPPIIIPLPSLPLNANGKVDRSSLLEPEKFQTKCKAYVPPRTSAETRIAEIWSEVLGNDRIGLGENFFEIGGHSLVGIQVMSRILNHFHVKLDVGTLFDCPTIEELAQAVERAVESGASETGTEEIRAVPREQYLWR